MAASATEADLDDYGLREACGLFGCVANVEGVMPSELDVAHTVHLGLVGVQHRGQESAGLVTSSGEPKAKFYMKKSMGLVNDAFKRDDLKKLKGNIGIGHTRYSTQGSSDYINIQPFVVETLQGRIAVAHNGELVNAKELKKKGGDLFEALSSATKYTERDASGMVYNLASALKYLHSINIVHRDIKPENILVCDHGDGSKSLKLGDFGLATEVNDILYTVCGTPTYVAPEVVAEIGYGVLVDMWSTGVITYILLCGFPPFISPTDNQDELFDLIMAGVVEFPSPFWDHVSDAAKDLILGLLETDTEKRLTAADVLQHPWVADDEAKEDDLHQNITQQLQTGIQLKKRHKGPAGIRLITTTALDKGSRYFQGRGNAPLTLQPRGHDLSDGEGDEIF